MIVNRPEGMRLFIADESWGSIQSTRATADSFPAPLLKPLAEIANPPLYRVDEQSTVMAYSSPQLVVAQEPVLGRLPAEFANKRLNILEKVVSEWWDKSFENGMYALKSRDEVMVLVPGTFDGKFFVPRKPIPLSSIGRAIVFEAAVDQTAADLSENDPKTAVKVLGEMATGYYFPRYRERVGRTLCEMESASAGLDGNGKAHGSFANAEFVRKRDYGY